MRKYGNNPVVYTVCICMVISLLLTSCLSIRAWATESTGGAGQETANEAGEDNGNQETTEASANNENQGPEISAPSAILMEASTGTVIYEKTGMSSCVRPA